MDRKSILTKEQHTKRSVLFIRFMANVWLKKASKSTLILVGTDKFSNNKYRPFSKQSLFNIKGKFRVEKANLCQKQQELEHTQ